MRRFLEDITVTAVVMIAALAGLWFLMDVITTIKTATGIY